MNIEQFNAALELTRLKSASIESARLHLVDGLTIQEAADAAGCKKQQTSRAVNTIIKKIDGITMSAKKLGIYLADESLEFLSLIQERHTEGNLTISSATNLAIQAAKIMAETKLPLSTNEILYACDVCNPGASLTEFQTPDSVSIRSALQSMMFGLVDCLNDPEYTEKWKLDAPATYKRFKALTEAEQFALAIATRQFWNKQALGDRKPPHEFENWHDWAGQYTTE